MGGFFLKLCSYAYRTALYHLEIFNEFSGHIWDVYPIHKDLDVKMEHPPQTIICDVDADKHSPMQGQTINVR